jgi:hypothetical protein
MPTLEINRVISFYSMSSMRVWCDEFDEFDEFLGVAVLLCWVMQIPVSAKHERIGN